MINPDWIAGLLGGMMIGTAGAIYLLFNGRIMGASSILGELVDGSARATAVEKAIFLIALIGTPALLLALPGDAFGPGQTNITGSLPLIVTGGVLVGLGTRLALGCTSGHGVCGMSRVAPRSIVASLVYVAGGMAMMTVLRHGLGVL
jgi:uncharacterized membrane protein YedE/YeeE